MGIFSPFRIKHMVAPATPATGESLLYPKSDGAWYTKEPGGVESLLARTGNRPYFKGTVGAVTRTANVDMPHTAVDDTHTAWTGTQYRAPLAGTYRVTLQAKWSTSPAIFYIAGFKNGTQIYAGADISGTPQYGGHQEIFYVQCAATDLISVRVMANGYTAHGSSSENNYLVVEQVSGEGLIAIGGDDTGWITPTLLNGFNNHVPGTFDAAGYRRINGIVYLRGMLENGTRTSGTTIFNLPVGFRPPLGSGKTHTNFAAAGTMTANGSHARVNIDPATGNVEINSAATSDWLSLSYISFPATGPAQTFSIPAFSESAVTPGAGITAATETIAYLRGGTVYVNVNAQLPASLASGSTLFTLPMALRPQTQQYVLIPIVTGIEDTIRCVVNPDGRVTNSITGPTGVPVLRGSFAFPGPLVPEANNGITGMVVQNSDTGWITPTFQNSWVDYGGNYPCRYRRINGVVHVKGLIRYGTVGGVPAFTLPVGFRPTSRSIFNTRTDGNPGSAYVELVDTTGDVMVVQATSSGWVSVDFTFPVPQQPTTYVQGDDTGWLPAPLANGWVNYGFGFTDARYRRVNGMVYLQGLVKNGTSPGTIFTLPEGFRPGGGSNGNLHTVQTSASGGTSRLDVLAGGAIYYQGTNNTYVSLGDLAPFPAENPPVAFVPSADTGWVNYSINWPNVPSYTTNYSKYRRVGNTVTTKQMITLTAGFGAGVPAYVNTPFPFAADTPLDGSFSVGTIRGLRSGVAFYTAIANPDLLSGRATFWEVAPNGSRWTGNFPATWASGDKWMLDMQYEAAPL